MNPETYLVRDIVAHSIIQEFYSVKGESLVTNTLYIHIVSTAYPQADGVQIPHKGLWKDVGGTLVPLRAGVDYNPIVYQRSGSYSSGVEFLPASKVTSADGRIDVYLFGTDCNGYNRLAIGQALRKQAIAAWDDGVVDAGDAVSDRKYLVNMPVQISEDPLVKVMSRVIMRLEATWYMPQGLYAVDENNKMHRLLNGIDYSFIFKGLAEFKLLKEPNPHDPNKPFVVVCDFTDHPGKLNDTTPLTACMWLNKPGFDEVAKYYRQGTIGRWGATMLHDAIFEGALDVTKDPAALEHYILQNGLGATCAG